MNCKKANFILLTAAMIGGFGIIANKMLYGEGYNAFQIIAVRFLFAAILTAVFFHKEIGSITKAEIKAGIVVGVYLFVSFALMVVGLKYTTPSINGFLANIHSVFVPFIAFALFRKRPDRFALAGIVLTVVGIGILSMEGKFQLNLGAVLTTVGAVCAAFQFIYTEKYVAGLSPIRLTVIEDFVVFFMAALCALAVGDPMPHMTGTAAGSFLISVVFSTFLFYVLENYAQKYTSSTSVSIIISSEAIFSAIYSALFYKEVLSPKIYIGAALIFGAIIISETKLAFLRRLSAISTEKESAVS